MNLSDETNTKMDVFNLEIDTLSKMKKVFHQFQNICRSRIRLKSSLRAIGHISALSPPSLQSVA